MPSVPTKNPTADVAQELRRCVRDLVALSTLSAVWGNADPPGIGRSLAEVLLRILSADFVYVRLHGRSVRPCSEVVRTRGRAETETRSREIGLALEPWLGCQDADQPPAIPSPVGEGMVRLAVLPIGHGDDHGLLAAGCVRSDFPTDTERLLLAVGVNQAASLLQRKEAEDRQRRSEQELADFFENATVGLHWVGPDGTILRVNRAELALLGYTQEQYVGRHIAEFHADPDVIAEILRRLAAGETVRDCEARMRCSDGTIRHVLIDSSVLWEDSRFVHTRCVTRDITDRKRAEESLQEADRRKDEFLATLAHELRNPLAPLRTAVQYLQLKGPSDPELVSARSLIERQVSHLTRLVDDLLDVSRISRGKINLRKERVTLAAIVTAALEASRPAIDAARHELTVELPVDPLWLEVDVTRLAQVLGNLLNNAAKYTDPGGRIVLTAERRGDEAIVCVRDTGIGIPAEHLGGLFEMFSQVDLALERSQGGLGIGLALVKGLVELHGGTVEARSQGPGMGSEFLVYLPLVLAPSTHVEATAAPKLVASPHCRVLIADDNKDAAESLALLLTVHGHEVKVAHDGQEALEVIETFRPEAALLDIGMPKLNGYETARRIRQQPGGGRIRLGALTGWGQEEDKRKAKEAGFDRHFTKPVDPEELARFLAEQVPEANR